MRRISYAIIACLAWIGGCSSNPPPAFTSSTSSKPPSKSVRAAPARHTLLFVGDVMLVRSVSARMKTLGDWDYPFEKIAPTLRAADLLFGNLECPISDAGRDLHHLYSFRADPHALQGLAYAGFKVLSVANNHIDDWDAPALVDTLSRLRLARIVPIGAGIDDAAAHRAALVSVGDAKIAFLAYVNIPPLSARAQKDQPGVAWLDPDRAVSDIRAARPFADILVVSLHWGTEYAEKPAPDQIALAHRLIDAGGDLIVGAHPHVAQPVEHYRGARDGWIAYSLGNFVFDQNDSATRHGLMLKVVVEGKRIADVTPVPIVIDNFQAHVAPADDLAHGPSNLQP